MLKIDSAKARPVRADSRVCTPMLANAQYLHDTPRSSTASARDPRGKPTQNTYFILRQGWASPCDCKRTCQCIESPAPYHRTTGRTSREARPWAMERIFAKDFSVCFICVSGLDIVLHLLSQRRALSDLSRHPERNLSVVHNGQLKPEGLLSSRKIHFRHGP